MEKSMTTDEDLWKLAKRFNIPLRDICFKDKLNDSPPSPGGYIINLADSTTHGTHWTAVWLDLNGTAAYNDSFGIAPPLAVEEFCRRYGCHKILMSQVQVQNISGGGCGQYCIDFLAFISRNQKLPLENRYRLFLNQFHDARSKP
jgi:hypothetical protein